MSWKKVGLGLWQLSKATARGSAEVAKMAKDLVVKNKTSISAGAKGALRGVGEVTTAVGMGVAAVSEMAAKATHQLGDSSSGTVGTVLGHATGYLADGTALLGKGAAQLGRGVKASAETTADVATGAVAGSVSVVSESLDAATISDSEIIEQHRTVVAYGEQLRQQSDETIDALKRTRFWPSSRADQLDRVVVGGITISAAIESPHAVPAAVESAFAAAYPGLARFQSFGEAAAGMSSDQLLGLVSGVKGKLFELQFVDYLNAGALPAGYSASTAPSATQAGWDIQITDSHGKVVDLLQAKATESVGYVRDALEKYPDIEITTTSEVYAQLAAIGSAEGVRDSGISEAALEQLVRSSVEDGVGLDLVDLLPSAVGLAVIALSVFLDASISPAERVRAFGERGAKAGASSLAGYGVLLLTQTWWLALVGGVGTHWLTGKGRSKRQQLDSLKATVHALRRLPQFREVPARPA
ncbi:MAG: hypothetical protein KDI51_01880 [Xanthomonadales bacterium]|nr:hypothetical protein [Xanthomonadales bacterium]